MILVALEQSTDLEIVRERAQEILSLLARWQQFQPKIEKLVSTRSAKQIALALLLRRQLVSLDGVRASAEAGRPEVILTVLRSMYEAWLYMLTIAYLVTPGRCGYWGRRFLAYGKYQRWQS